MQEVKKRDISLDIIKAFAIFAVLFMHNVVEWKGKGGYLYDWYLEGLYGIVRFGVPVFFMIMGILLLDEKKEISTKKIWKKYIFRIIVAALFYGLIYKTLRVVLTKTFMSVGAFAMTYIKEFCTGQLEFHFWFVYAVIGVYISIPILRAFVKNASDHLMKYFLFLWLLESVLELISHIEQFAFVGVCLNSFRFLNLFLGYTGYVVWGYYLNKHLPDKKKSVCIYVVAFFGLMVACYQTGIYEIVNGGVDYNWMMNESPFIIFWSTAVFIFLKNRKWNSELIICKGLAWVGSHTFSIYFIHMVSIIALLNTEYVVIPVSVYLQPWIWFVITVLMAILWTGIVQMIPKARKYI